MIVEAAKSAAKKAYAAGDYKAVASNLTVIMKTTKVDQDDTMDLNSVMSPPDFEPTSNLEALGEEIEIIENPDEERIKLRALFHSKAKQEKYTDYEDPLKNA